jgi:hypothetical protein
MGISLSGTEFRRSDARDNDGNAEKVGSLPRIGFKMDRMGSKLISVNLTYSRGFL